MITTIYAFEKLRKPIHKTGSSIILHMNFISPKLLCFPLFQIKINSINACIAIGRDHMTKIEGERLVFVGRKGY